MKKQIKVAIDGPAGAGKSTIAKAVAQRLGIFYVDTGAMYRAIALKTLRSSIPIDREEEVGQMVQKTEIVLEHSEARRVFCDGKDVTVAIRNPEVSRAVSKIAAYPIVRERLVQLQRQEAERGAVIMDGRDIGTVVLPQADLKIFLTASPEERAYRRWLELRNSGKELSLAEVQHDMENRDKQDSEREVAPLVPAEDALILDTTGLSIEKIVDQIITLTAQL
ncbi:(d)CMP kinase [Desulfitobacterium metallireducens]|uniref:Cytidylate kinase n=1 Tax=Desulfitobacterium metallireducens DSM 15288 TaxID=871968 RepID=W0E8V1_9FIRM|nr:(d)CMP kinase [Desulfitobacterium metallireducens]AHF07285.1 cytidylate kinase [Desulfitobacterium metallireducens DSM 15288]